MKQMIKNLKKTKTSNKISRNQKKKVRQHHKKKKNEKIFHEIN